MMKCVNLITLGVNDLKLSKKFYVDGFGWQIKSQDNDTVLYQMHGFILSTWLNSSLEDDIQISLNKKVYHNSSFAYFVEKEEEVNSLISVLLSVGGKLIRSPSKPVHGGIRGYIADPDNHIWEIIYNNNFLRSNGFL